MYVPTDNVSNPWVYYYSTAYRTPEDDACFDQFDAQDQASTVVKVRSEDVELATSLCKKATGGREPPPEYLAQMVDLVSSLRQNIDGVLIRQFPEDVLSIAELKRIVEEQCSENPIALQIGEDLARQSCHRFGITLQ